MLMTNYLMLLEGVKQKSLERLKYEGNREYNIDSGREG
jgi:hypothetical protein